ncbi:MAG: hypothetical protein RR101_12300 [Burkholderiaceae bacterium]
MFKRIGSAIFAILTVVWLAGCATPATTLDAQWANPQFAGKNPIQSVMVITVTRDATNRRIFEDQMVAMLSARGVKAVQSYRFIPNEDRVEDAALKKAVADAGVANVMLTRVINVSEKVNYSPGYMMGPAYGMGWGGFYGYYSGMWAATYAVPPQVYTTQSINSDTRVFNVKDGVVLWSAATTTSTGYDTVRQMIDQFVQLIVNTLAKDGML